ncbi:alpha-1-antitrypsin-like [Mus caroli]|uniref:Alpha-1-antitrypsin-like n=1 Tax=Mus caroli TaxID=10089 RepID=A0A6P5QSR0_MUSCR|nr:alpha-1-antitrypsin-like [Mus caroli]
MLSLGTKNNTYDQILEGLNFNLTETPENFIHECFQQLTFILQQPDHREQMTMNSSLFTHQNLKLTDTFVQDVKRLYHSKVVIPKEPKTRSMSCAQDCTDLRRGSDKTHKEHQLETMSPYFYRNFFLLASLCYELPGSQTKGYQETDALYHDNKDQELPQCRKITPTITNISLFLLEKAIRWPKQTNIVFSPVNIMAAFDMLSLGAQGSTHHQILKGLRLSLIDMTEREVHKCFQYFLHTLFQPNQQLQLTMGSSLFIDKPLKVANKFKNVVTESYHSEAIPIDFRDTRAAMTQVNKHVEEQSYGHIVQVIKELPIDTVLALVNYIYFEGIQNVEVDADHVLKAKFYLDSGKVDVVTMVNRLGKFYLHKDESLSSWVLVQHFVGNAMAIFILPDLGKMQQLVQNLSHEYLNRLHRHINPRFANLFFPKFTISATYDLITVMRQLGITQIFSSEADLSKVTMDGPVKLSKILILDDFKLRYYTNFSREANSLHPR